MSRAKQKTANRRDAPRSTGSAEDLAALHTMRVGAVDAQVRTERARRFKDSMFDLQLHHAKQPAKAVHAIDAIHRVREARLKKETKSAKKMALQTVDSIPQNPKLASFGEAGHFVIESGQSVTCRASSRHRRGELRQTARRIASCTATLGMIK